MSNAQPHEVIGTRVEHATEAPVGDVAVRLLRQGQLAIRLADDAIVRIVEIDLEYRRILLDDSTWVSPEEIEDPLRSSYRWDVERGLREKRYLDSVKKGDFAAVFPRVVAARHMRRPDPGLTGDGAYFVALAALESFVVYVLILAWLL